ncbi:MAG TPA: GNAT family N-acetyltransferase [Gemmataceae bacterium]|nr:GNAT family N-acetyltransferase [Gemmataceae bacterium]
MIEYRHFRNDDPPGLAVVWNEALSERGEVRLRHSSPLENYVFSKPYFDPAGLIVAVEDKVYVGFAHAGFGPNEAQTALDKSNGVTCAIAVRPSYRRRGVGSELLQRCENYLRAQGSQAVLAGPMPPFHPFYFGLYGGSDLPGFLVSDQAAEPFLRHHGYEIHGTTLVLHRSLGEAVNVADGRFAALRRRFELRMAPKSGAASWWQECVQGPVEMVEFLLADKTTGDIVARTSVWEMDGFSWRWNQPTVGIVSLVVREDLRRQGLAKFLIAQLLRYLQEQFFALVEIQVNEANSVALSFCQGLGFQKVDSGRLFKKT